MNKMIPYEKLSKKEKKKRNALTRQGWGSCNPVTRCPKNSRAYSRKKTRNWERELPESGLFSCKMRDNP